MSAPGGSLRTAMAALAREELHGAAHPPVSRLIAYYRGEIPPAELAAIREHLSLCRECTAVVLDAADFFGDDEEIEEETEEEAAAARPPLVRSLGFVYALAATFAAVSLSLLLWYPLRPAPSPQPLANVPLIYVLASEAVRGEPIGAARIPRLSAREPMTLTLNPGRDLPGDRFGLRVRAADGAVVWSHADLRLQKSKEFLSGVFTLGLPPGALPAGRYQIEVYGFGGTGETRLGTFPIVIEK